MENEILHSDDDHEEDLLPRSKRESNAHLVGFLQGVFFQRRCVSVELLRAELKRILGNKFRVAMGCHPFVLAAAIVFSLPSGNQLHRLAGVSFKARIPRALRRR